MAPKSENIVCLVELANQLRKPGDTSTFKTVLREHFAHSVIVPPESKDRALESCSEQNLIEMQDYLVLGTRFYFVNSKHAVYLKLQWT